MDGVALRELMESALQRMEQDGASGKALTSYRSTGFGAIVRYCEAIDSPEYAEATIDEFINQLRAEYERGEVLKWKWWLVRRGGELLKHLHNTGTIDLPRCEQWEALLRAELSARE